ncbi:transcription factor mef2A [Stomoxys calcitrans]|uniref:transcription factor mef2A n=1 Tax=Stomoxys calcitrans TaxID=35570 RepID=UPI0027E2FCAC|nr:transcription factor mef2A [Stomoxys calcitrans]
MIGTDEMSSTGMDISESFRPEDISKTDFFDFVTAPDMGIGLGVNVNLHHTHHNHHHHNHHTITSPQQQPQPHHQHHHHHQPQQHHHHHHTQQPHHNPASSPMTHDGGGGGGSGNGGGPGGGGSGSVTSVSANGGDSHGDTSGLSDGSSASTTDPALHGYEFWTSDKEHTSTIFEDLDRYCWQQQSNSSTTATSVTVPSNGAPNNSNNNTNNSSNQMHHVPSPANSLNPLHSSLVNPTSPHNHHSPVTPVSTTTSSSLPTTPVSQTQLNSDGTISNIISTDGQIYTLTVLNGNEPWLKRETDTQLQSTLDLDSLLGTFPGYIKSEYPYDDSGFSTDGCKDLNGDSANLMGSSSQRLPSLINTISSVTSSGGMGGVGGLGGDGAVTALSIGQQLDQFHNNNNDWHMTDHNNEQNSAESLLRSALQGKGYTKGLHMHNGITLMPTSPSVKDDDMRRILFPVDADGLNFPDTSLNAAQIFDDPQSANGHNTHMIVPHSPVTNGPLTPVTNPSNAAHNSNNNGSNNNNNNQANSMMVDDMFLTLENAFSDDFEKIKQFCTTATANDYHHGNEVMMQISPSITGGSGGGVTQTSATSINPMSVTTAQQQLQALHAASSAATSTNAIVNMPGNQVLQQQQKPPAQPLKPEVTTSNQRIVTTAKVTKKYKRTLSSHSTGSGGGGAGVSNNNNNNNPNAINHNNSNNNSNNNNSSSNLSTSKGSGNLSLTNGAGANRNGSASSGSSTTSSNSTPSTSSSSSSTSGGQRKERSLHYCSICSKGFKDKYSVNVHIRTHTGEKPFACTLCGKSFRQKAHLAKHYQTHMAQKNNGSLVKGNSNKHHRSSSASASAAAAAAAQQQQQQQGLNPSVPVHNHVRPMSANSAAPTTPTLPHGLGLVNGMLTTSAGLALGVPQQPSSLPPTPSTPTAILPPANGLLANR